MATTVTNEKLKVTLSMKIGTTTLERTFQAANINEYDNRVISVSDSEVNLMQFAAAASAGTYAINTLKFAAIINRDDTNSVRLRLKTITNGVIKTLGVFAAGNYYKNGIYSNTPFLGGSGTGATGNFTASGSAIYSLNTLIGGTGYVVGTYLDIPLTGGSGTLARANVVVGATNGVSSVLIQVAGTGHTNGTYTNVPITQISPSGGAGALATVVVAGGAITSITITNAGSGYTAGAYATINPAYLGGTGTGFLGAILTSSAGAVTSVQITNFGSGYAVNDTLSASNTNLGGTGSGFSIKVFELCGPITMFALQDAGKNYQVGDILLLSPGDFGGIGTGFTVPVTALQSTSDIVDFNLEPGRFFALGNSKFSTDNFGGSFLSFKNIESISAQADINPTDIEIFTASE